MKTFLLLVGLIFIPVFYLGFILVGMYFPLSCLYKSIFEHYKSSEPFGIFG